MPQRIRPNKVPAEDLILANDPLAVDIAKRYFTLCRSLQEVDVVQIARQGLIRGARAYNPHRISKYTYAPVAFSSFVVPYIRGEILHYIRDWGHVLKIPRKLRERASKVEREAREKAISPRRVAESYGWDWGELEEVLETHVVYPDSVFFEENIAVEGSGSQVSDEILNALAKLPPWQSRLIIEHYYQGKSIAAIASGMGRSVEDVQSWINKATKRLAADKELGEYATN
jgi:RNA polymerase sigma factor (sigma-70 family)